MGDVSGPGDMLLGVLGGLWAAMWASPWIGALVLAVFVGAVVRAVRGLVHGLHRKDDRRRFPAADKAAILQRAGQRCEHHHPLYGRCKQTEGLEADHVHPHSRGGWTSVENGQALCRRHNKFKSARVPWNWQLKRLARRRADYFPPGIPTEVTRYRGRDKRDGTPATVDVREPSEASDGRQRRRPLDCSS